MSIIVNDPLVIATGKMLTSSKNGGREGGRETDREIVAVMWCSFVIESIK